MAVLSWWRHLSGSRRLCVRSEGERKRKREKEKEKEKENENENENEKTEKRMNMKMKIMKKKLTEEKIITHRRKLN